MNSIKLIAFQISVIIFISCTEVPKKQDSNSLEGYYNLSEHEAPAHLYLQDDNTFYYYLIVGSIDLEIYGEYTIIDNELKFYPKKELLEDYILYGKKNATVKTTQLNFSENGVQTRENQFLIGMEKQWYSPGVLEG